MFFDPPKALMTAAVAVLSGVLATSSVAQTTIKLAHSVAPDTPIGRAAESFAEAVNSAGNDLNVEVFPAESLGHSYQLKDMLTQGSLEAAIVGNFSFQSLGDQWATAKLPGGALSLPFIFGNASVAQQFAETAGREFFASADQHNLCPLGVAMSGTRRLVAAQRLDSFEDQIARNGVIVSNESFSSLLGDGAVIERDPNTQHALFLTGEVLLLGSWQLDHFQSQLAAISQPITHYFSVLTMNCDQLERLSDDQREVLESAAARAMETLGALSLEQENAVEAAVMDSGGSVLTYVADDGDDDGCGGDECSSFGPGSSCPQEVFFERLIERAKECCSDESSCPQ